MVPAKDSVSYEANEVCFFYRLYVSAVLIVFPFDDLAIGFSNDAFMHALVHLNVLIKIGNIE